MSSKYRIDDGRALRASTAPAIARVLRGGTDASSYLGTYVMRFELRASSFITTTSRMHFRLADDSIIELSPNNRAGCNDTQCKKAAAKCLKGSLRFGTWTMIMDQESWKWKHWGCVSGEQLKHVQDAVQRGGGYDFDAFDGYDELNDHPDLQQKIRDAIKQGHIAPEDFNGDPWMNKPGQRGIRGKKPKDWDDGEEGAEANGAAPAPAAPAPAANGKKRGRKSAAADDDEEEEKPKAKRTKKAAAKVEPKEEDEEEEEKPKPKATTKRGKAAAAVKTEDDAEEAPKPRAKRAAKKAAVKEESEDEQEEEPAPKPKRGAAKKAAPKKAAAKIVKSEETEEEPEADEPTPETEEEEKPAPKKAAPKGRKKAAPADAAAEKPKRSARARK